MSDQPGKKIIYSGSTYNKLIKLFRFGIGSSEVTKIVACIIKRLCMLYMVIEHFHPGQVKELYRRFDEKGRMLPKGVLYIDSWINEDMSICYQVMESDSIEKLHEWICNWNDIVDFKIIPVISSAEAKRRVNELN